LAASVLVGIAVVVFWPGEREPEYNGKKLSQWLSEKPPRGAISILEETDADDAIRHIGTNALPFLVRWIQTDPKLPAWREKLFNFVYYRTFNARAKYVILQRIDAPRLRLRRAMWAIKTLGPEARTAVDDLVRVATNGQVTASAAVMALGYIGPDALPVLLAFAEDRAFKYRVDAIVAIGHMPYLGTNAHSTVLCLTNCLKDQDMKVAAEAAVVLAGLGIESEISVPALAECLRSRDETLRSWGAIGLEKFSETARSAVPGLRACLEDKHDYVRVCATNALRKIAPGVLTNGVTDF
jgi:HEAT repeat protein